MKQLSYLPPAPSLSKDVILNAFYHDMRLGYTHLSRSRIASLTGKKVSPHLIAHVETMVKDGILERVTTTLNNGAMCYAYRVIAE